MVPSPTMPMPKGVLERPEIEFTAKESSPAGRKVVANANRYVPGKDRPRLISRDCMTMLDRPNTNTKGHAVQVLQLASQSQGRWSATATSLKRSYDRMRLGTFVLSILGALAAALASQWHQPAVHNALTALSVAMLGVSGVLSARFLRPNNATRWARARGASEALKRAAYQCATQAAPYDDPATREAQLRAEVNKVETDVDDLLDVQAPAHDGTSPSAPITAPEYLATRVGNAIQWYEASATMRQKSARRLRAVELLLALASTIISAMAGALPKEVLAGWTAGVDLAAMVAVITTISGTVMAHIEASRYDYLVSSYRAAARKLRNELSAAPESPVVPSPDWSAFVVRCEDVIANETGSWAARFSKPAAG